MNQGLKRIIFIIIGVILITAVLYFLFFFRATVIINPEPSNAQIEIAGKVSLGKTTIKLMPGTHRLKITSPGYVAFDQDITAKVSQRSELNIKLKTEPKLEKISNYPGQFVTTTLDGKSLLYLSNNGKTIYKVDNVLASENFSSYAITPDVFSDVANILWHPDKELAIIRYNDGDTSLYDFNRYDLLHQEKKDWGGGIKGISWRSDGEKIIYYFEPGNGEKSLIRANKDNSGMERIFDMRPYSLIDPAVYWSADQKTVLLVSGELHVFDVYTKTLKKIEGINAVTSAQFTPDSQKILYEKKGSLFIIGIDGKDNQDLGIQTTLKKLTWFDEASFVYAVREAGKNTDSLLKYNLVSKEQISFDYGSSGAVNASGLIISSDKNKLFFTDSFIYGINLAAKTY